MIPKRWDIIKNLNKLGKKRHPKCLGYTTNTMDGYESDCGYRTTLTCEECKYGLGKKDPEAKINQTK